MTEPNELVVVSSPTSTALLELLEGWHLALTNALVRPGDPGDQFWRALSADLGVAAQLVVNLAAARKESG